MIHGPPAHLSNLPEPVRRLCSQPSRKGRGSLALSEDSGPYGMPLIHISSPPPGLIHFPLQSTSSPPPCNFLPYSLFLPLLPSLQIPVSPPPPTLRLPSSTSSLPPFIHSNRSCRLGQI
ncbi:hypothetical protein Pcinc_042699 [Petrolisthes cinctipes]|uniref:Uncharacterized protein n=1 Tax=Petrolisthes cinctipes TaxID=88211 RepID=A0AAE1EFR7_PETCI|nr:hypothetical protein Pcinc_042699 [Petrolisthes cinctipes]